ncbi:hypothetical protein WJX73_003094, partial [Symbiochloris irregularis]
MSEPSSRRAQVEEKYASLRGHFPKVPAVTAAELHTLMSSPDAANVLLVDTRTEAEIEVSRIPGSISKAEFEQHKEESAGKTIIAYCTVGFRSGQYLKPLHEAGFDTKNLAGSILAWTHEQYPLVTGPGQGIPTKKVHTFSKGWSLQEEGYEPVFFDQPRTYLEMLSASPTSDENLLVWTATVFGPDETAWEGGIFSLRITFAEAYPDKPPRVRFLSEMYHPNVYSDGTICLDIIQDQWSPCHN